MLYTLLAILGLGILVVVHEAGHYFVARWSDMRVERFSIGFGPPVLKWKSGETQFQLAPIPFGGFVQIVGMNPHEEFDEKDPRVYPNRPALLRFLTILAGPAMNYVAGTVFIFAVYAGAGVQTGRGWYTVGEVFPGKPAEGHFQVGDRLVAVNGQPVLAVENDEKQPDFAVVIQKTADKPVRITVERGGKNVDMMVAPRFEAETKDYRFGIRLDIETERRHVGLGSTVGHALAYPGEMSSDILGGLWKIIKREEKLEVKGPVGIVQAVHTQIEYGWVRSLEVLAMLSVYLGLFNLLPFPGLDGGRLVFLVYELTTRRRANPKVEATVHMFGFVLLFLVIILVTFKDIKNLFT